MSVKVWRGGERRRWLAVAAGAAAARRRVRTAATAPRSGRCGCWCRTPRAAATTSPRARAAKAMEDAGPHRATSRCSTCPARAARSASAGSVNERGNGKLVMSMGLGVVGAVYTNKSPSSLAGHHPDRAAHRGAGHRRGRQGLAVHGRSQQLLDAWKADPGAVPVGGGSSPGGPDHLAPMLMAKAVGLAARRRSTTSRSTAAASCSPRCSAARSRSASPASASTATRSRPATLRVLAVTERGAHPGRRRADAAGVRCGRRVHQLARHRRAAGHLRRPTRDKLVDAVHEPARRRRSGRRRCSATAGRTPSRRATSSATFLDERERAGGHRAQGAWGCA